MTELTIILPHKRNPGNDAALRIALDMLFANTRADFHLLIDAAYDQPLYERLNRMVAQADTECVVYWSSDMFPAPDWDTPMLRLFDSHTFVTNVLVESGAIGVHHQNVERDFGRRPETFRRAEFEAWAATKPPYPPGEGWYAPFMFPKTGFLELGGLRLDLGPFPAGAPDIELFKLWKAVGRRVVRAASYTYHMQRYSDVQEQEAAKRR